MDSVLEVSDINPQVSQCPQDLQNSFSYLISFPMLVNNDNFCRDLSFLSSLQTAVVLLANKLEAGGVRYDWNLTRPTKQKEVIKEKWSNACLLEIIKEKRSLLVGDGSKTIDVQVYWPFIQFFRLMYMTKGKDTLFAHRFLMSRK